MKKRIFNIVVSLLLVSIYIVGFTENIQVYASYGNVKLSVKKLYTLSEHITTYPYITIENYNGYVEWTVENNSIADIVYRKIGDTSNTYSKTYTAYSNSKCFINPKSSGTTKITAKYDGGILTCKLYVSDPDEAVVKYIKTGKNPYKLKKQEIKAAKAIKKRIKKMNKKKMNRVQKIKAVHDYIIKNCSYNYDAYYNNNASFSDLSVSGPTLKHLAVCEGYSRTFRVYMLAMGIPCKFVKGVSNSGGVTGNHAWNMVKCSDGKWYHIDVTWDDSASDSYVKYAFFLLTDKQIKSTRTWVRKDYPKCNGKKFNKYREKLVN